jgi:fructose-1,6-bisphosphatase
MFGHLPMVELLIRRGANPAIIAEHFGSVREVAVQFGNNDVILYLDSISIPRYHSHFFLRRSPCSPKHIYENE